MTDGEFTVEKGGKQVQLRFRRPVRSDFTAYKNSLAEIKREYDNASEATKEAVNEQGFLKLDKLHVDLLIKLNADGSLKSMADFDDMAQEDVQKLFAWLVEKLRADYDRFLRK